MVLIAPSVENSGIIEAEDGLLVLAAGRKVTLTSLDLEGVQFEVQAPEDEVVNLGALLAEQGAAGVFAGTIRHSGEIRANSISVDETGAIVLSAQADIHVEEGSTLSASGPAGGEIRIESETGTTWVAGEIDASADEGRGGTVQVLGERVGLIERATVDASGESGGGEILIGGDYRGETPRSRTPRRPSSVRTRPFERMRSPREMAVASSSGPPRRLGCTDRSALPAALNRVTVDSSRLRVTIWTSSPHLPSGLPTVKAGPGCWTRSTSRSLPLT